MADVLPEGRFELGSRLPQVPADRAEALTLIVRQRIHGVENHRPHPGLLELGGQLLAIEFEQDRIEESLRLAAGRSGGDHHVQVIDMRGPDGALLMCIERVINQGGQETLGAVRETLGREQART